MAYERDYKKTEKEVLTVVMQKHCTEMRWFGAE